MVLPTWYSKFGFALYGKYILKSFRLCRQRAKSTRFEVCAYYKKYSSVMSRLTDVWIPVTAVDEGVAPSVTE